MPLGGQCRPTYFPVFNLGQVFPVLTAGFGSVTLPGVITEELTLLLFPVEVVVKERWLF